MRANTVCTYCAMAQVLDSSSHPPFFKVKEFLAPLNLVSVKVIVLIYEMSEKCVRNCLPGCSFSCPPHTTVTAVWVSPP